MTTVKLLTRPSGAEGAFVSYALTVPAEIGRETAANGIESFVVELTEDGILYRPILRNAPGTGRPAWLRPNIRVDRAGPVSVVYGEDDK